MFYEGENKSSRLNIWLELLSIPRIILDFPSELDFLSEGPSIMNSMFSSICDVF